MKNETEERMIIRELDEEVQYNIRLRNRFFVFVAVVVVAFLISINL